MSGYSMALAFDIDGDELAGLTPQQCFVLGAEFGRIAHMMMDGADALTQSVHEKNSARIRSAARHFGYTVTLSEPKDGWRVMSCDRKGA